MKYIEIKGIGFPNKGAELLLCAILEQLKSRDMVACMEPYSPFEYKLDYPVLTKTSIYKYGINILFPLNVLPKYITSRLGFIHPNKIDLILDASGFAYGDDWSLSLAKSRILSKKNINAILLPQSLGPFTKKDSVTVAKKIAESVTTIYSREHTGAEFFKEATGRAIEYCPDITFGLQVPSAVASHDVLLIPNFQVQKREGKGYVDNLMAIVEYLIKVKREVKLLNHEGIKDYEICKELKQRIHSKLNIQLEILNPKTGVEAKREISGAKLLITSRYHGLISALSQKIPVACYGWSFKYNDALTRFKLPLFNLSTLNEKELSEITSPEYASIFSSIAYAKELELVKAEVKKMWLNVFG